MRDKKGRFTVNPNSLTKKLFKVKCQTCGVERLKCYKDYWAIKKGLTTDRCKPCSRFKKGETNNGGFKKGTIPWNKGYGKASSWQRIKLSKEWKEMREIVFKRDGWSCQECKLVGGVLHPHHIKPKSIYPELVFVLENVVTLCKDCHKKTDSYGYRAKKIKRI